MTSRLTGWRGNSPMDSGTAFDVIVAGGGFSGLACAEAILRVAPDTNLLCLEARERVGGSIRTVRQDGFLMEAGPAGFLDKSGAVRRLAAALGLERDLVFSAADDRSRWILSGGRLRRFPASVSEFLRSDLLSVRGKLRMLAEPLLPFDHGASGDETVREFAQRRLGPEAARFLVGPIVSGIYAADPAQVSVLATLPHLAALETERRSLLFAFLRASGRASPLVSFRRGCGDLIDALVRRLGGSVVCDSPVLSVMPAAWGYSVRVGGKRPRQLHCRALVSAAPATAAARYLDGMDAELAWQLGQVRYASVAVVALGFRRADVPRRLRGFGYLVPPGETSPVLGVQYSSSIYPGHRAPPDFCLLRLFLGGACRPTLARERETLLAEVAMTEVQRTLGIVARPVVCRVDRHLAAMPQYLPEHSRRVADIERRLQGHPGLFVGGNGLRGLGLDALARDAEVQASHVAKFFDSVWLARPDAAEQVLRHGERRS